MQETSKKIRKAIFPVGGLGTRFLPATKSIPKEMLPVLDKPLVQYAVDEALEAGIEEFIFVTGRGKSAIEDYFDHSIELEKNLKDNKKLEKLDVIQKNLLKAGSVFFVRQQNPLGLGHAVWCARNFIADEPAAIILADDLIEPLRPIADNAVQLNRELFAGALTPDSKKLLASLVNIEIDTNDGASPLSLATVKMCRSVVAYYSGETEQIFLPKLPKPLAYNVS